MGSWRRRFRNPASCQKFLKTPDQDPRRFFDVAFSPNFAADKANFSATFLWDEFLKSEDQGQSWTVVALPNPKGLSLRGLTVLPSPNYAEDQTPLSGHSIRGDLCFNQRRRKFFST